MVSSFGMAHRRGAYFRLRADQRRGGFNAPDIVGREFEDSNFASGQVLLITNVLIRSDEESELRFSKSQQFTVLDAAPMGLNIRA